MRSACIGKLVRSPCALSDENHLTATFPLTRKHFKERMDPFKTRILMGNPSNITSARAFDDEAFAHFVLARAFPRVLSHCVEWVSFGFPFVLDWYR